MSGSRGVTEGLAAGWRRWNWAIVGLGAGLVVGWLLTRPPHPAGSRPRLAAFDPEEIATLEQQAWEAYYRRAWARLFWLMLRVMRGQFGLSWASALQAAYLATRAQGVFAAPEGGDGTEAQALMRRFYALARGPIGGAYAPDQAAAAETRWWIVHRNRRDYPDDSQLVHAMTDLYATVYGLPPEAVAEAARHRVAAIAISDRWLDGDKPVNSPLLRHVRDELAASYRALRAAVGAAATARD